MNCQDTQNILSRYLDRELSFMDQLVIEAHLSQCAFCKAEYARQERLWNVLVRVEPIASPNLMASIEARLSNRYSWASLVAGFRLRSIGYATVTAALVGLFVWTGILAGEARYATSAEAPDRTFTELLSDAPPGMEVVVVLERVGER